MKKSIALFAVLILTLTTALSGLAEPISTPLPPAAAAGAAVRTFFQDAWLISSLMTRDALYVKDMDGRVMRQGWTDDAPETLCQLLPQGQSWSDWDWEKQAADPNYMARLVYGDGALWAATSEQAGTVDASGIHWSVAYDEAPGGWGVQWSHVRDGKLYGLVDYTVQEEKELEWNYSVFIVDLATGATRRIKTPGAYSMTPYRDGTLLLLRLRKDGTAYLSQLDTQLEELVEMPLSLPQGAVSGLSWDEASDNLAVVTEKNVWVSKAGAEFQQSIDLLPIQGFSVEMMSAALTSSGSCALRVGDVQTYPLGTHSDQEKIPLSAIATFGSVDAQRAFLLAHPQVDLTVRDDTDILMPADVAERVRSGDKADVFGVWLTSGFSALIAKGYAAPFDAGQDVTAILPRLRQAITNDAGQSCAGIVTLNVSLRTVNRPLWDDVLASTPVPTTWLEYLTLEKDFIEAHIGDGLLLDMYFTCEDAFWQIMQSWIGRALAADQPVDFSDPLLSDTLDALWQVKQAMNQRGMTVLDEAQLHPESEVGGIYSLIWGETAESTLGYNEAELANVLLPFTFAPDDPPVVSARAQVMVVNPQSAHIDLAADFAAINTSVWKNARRSALLDPASAAPTEREGWQERHEELLGQQAELEEKLTDAPDEAVHDLREQLEAIGVQIQQHETYRWEVSQAGLDWWRKNSRFIYLFDNTLYCDADSATGSQLMKLGQQWLEGQLTVDEMLAQFHKRAAMIALEGD